MIAPYAALSPARGHYVALVRALRMPANTDEDWRFVANPL